MSVKKTRAPADLEEALDDRNVQAAEPSTVPPGFLSPSVKEYLELGKSIPGKANCNKCLCILFIPNIMQTVGRRIAAGRSPVQGVLTNFEKDSRSWQKNSPERLWLRVGYSSYAVIISRAVVSHYTL